MPDRVESFREINNSEDRLRARPGFVKPIRNGLRKKNKLIQGWTVQGGNRLGGEGEWS